MGGGERQQLTHWSVSGQTHRQIHRHTDRQTLAAVAVAKMGLRWREVRSMTSWLAAGPSTLGEPGEARARRLLAPPRRRWWRRSMMRRRTPRRRRCSPARTRTSTWAATGRQAGRQAGGVSWRRVGSHGVGVGCDVGTTGLAGTSWGPQLTASETTPPPPSSSSTATEPTALRRPPPLPCRSPRWLPLLLLLLPVSSSSRGLACAR